MMTEMDLNSIFANTTQQLLKITKEFYGDNLVSFVIYGSVGRRCPNYTSDIDLLIILERLPQGRMNRVKEFEKLEQKVERYIEDLEKYGIYSRLSPLLKTRDEVILGSLLFLDMLEDAQILYDKDNFFLSYLNEFKKRLKRLGAKKVKEGTRWYWILKPDYRPGDIFEI
jgi:hypothetical protein